MTVSALNLKLKFPAFKELDDATIQFAIEEAQLSVNDKWLTKDQNLAVMYLAAHLLTVSDAAAAVYEERGREVVSETIGRLSTTYRSSSDKVPGGLDTTMYGARFLELRSLNFPAILVV